LQTNSTFPSGCSFNVTFINEDLSPLIPCLNEFSSKDIKISGGISVFLLSEY
jgi:hypothetical protein